MINLGSCGFCYKCHKPILSYEESLMIGNPILICKECEDRLARVNTEWNKAIKKEMEK